jgi:23S rRNA pseudouridine1911/1915/1917 synthase
MENHSTKKKGFKPDTVFKVKEENELMKFLIEMLPHKSRNNIKSLLSGQQIEVNGKLAQKFNHLLKPGNEVKIKWERAQPTVSFKGFTLVYEDQHLIVINKDAGILSIATDTEREKTAYSYLSAHVKREGPEMKIFIVHRLDRDTSGLMVFAKSKKVQHLMQENWDDVITERSYVAVTEGAVENDEGVVTSYLHENSAFVVYSNQNPFGGKKAITNYKVLKRSANYSLLDVKLNTGRKNQIRVHMQDLGHPIINDKKYGATQNPIGRLGLHAQVLAFVHPITKKNMRFETPIPPKFLSLV